MKPILAAFAAMCTLAFGQVPTIKAIIESGPATLLYGAEPGDFATGTSENIYAPADGPAVKVVYFGFEMNFPADSKITITSISYLLKTGVLNGPITDYRSGNATKFLSPTTGTSFPYCAIYNAAGSQTSVNNANIIGTVTTGKKIVFGAHRWKFGANYPVEHPALGTSNLQSYMEGLTCVGTYQVGGVGPVLDFNFQPGNPSDDTLTVKHAFAVLATRITKADWMNQFAKPTNIFTPVGGGLAATYTDTSGLLGAYGGYSVLSFETSVDLLEWVPFNSAIQDDVSMSGSTFTLKLKPAGMTGPHRFFRLKENTVGPSSVSWWPSSST